MGLQVKTVDAKSGDVTFQTEKVIVGEWEGKGEDAVFTFNDSEPTLQDCLTFLQEKGVKNEYVPTRRGRTSEDEEKAEKGIVNLLIEVINLYLYRQNLPAKVEDPRDKAIRRTIALINDKDTVLRTIAVFYPNGNGEEIYNRLKPAKK
jgi:hypothetical protein